MLKTIRAFREFLKIFPGCERLTLTGWSEFISPEALAGAEDDVELGLSTPLTLTFLSVLRTSSIRIATLRWLDQEKSVRLTRRSGSRGEFERELFIPI